MRSLILFLLLQEFYYSILLVIFGVAIGVQHGVESGLRAFLLSLIFRQFVIFWIKRKVIKDFLNPEIKDKKE